MGAFGIMNGVNDTDAMWAVNHWCNEYGLDTISTGAAISFAIECYTNGVLTKEDTDGLDLVWGNASAVLSAIHKIGRREGDLGELLADGTTVAANKIGDDAKEYLTAIDGEKLLVRPKEFYDGATPSGNSVMALNLARLFKITGNRLYNQKLL